MKTIYGTCGENLIGKCESCDWCPFETILTKEQKNRGVLNKSLYKVHPHREMIEQVCGKRYDDVCEMKYAIMRTDISDFDLVQIGTVVKNFCLDYGKKVNRCINGNEGLKIWTEKCNIGRYFDESYSARFREVWNLGLRNFNGEKEPYQILSGLFIYNIIISDSKRTYNSAIKLLEQLYSESEKRNR